MCGKVLKRQHSISCRYKSTCHKASIKGCTSWSAWGWWSSWSAWGWWSSWRAWSWWTSWRAWELVDLLACLGLVVLLVPYHSSPGVATGGNILSTVDTWSQSQYERMNLLGGPPGVPGAGGPPGWWTSCLGLVDLLACLGLVDLLACLGLVVLLECLGRAWNWWTSWRAWGWWTSGGPPGVPGAGGPPGVPGAGGPLGVPGAGGPVLKRQLKLISFCNSSWCHNILRISKCVAKC